jgi:hypothetical protein
MFAEKNYAGAVRKYHSALLIAKGIQNSRSNAGDIMTALSALGTAQGEFVEWRALIDDVMVRCYNNLAGESGRHEFVSQIVEHIIISRLQRVSSVAIRSPQTTTTVRSAIATMFSN